ncbi:MAG: CvpA family protein [Bacteroidales bacterium]|nr:CvpA family protein [Candidatus Cryptobacteroides onthequi]
MSTLDIIILICFLPAVISGIHKGFIAQVISIVSLFVGIWLAFHFSDLACSWLSQYLTGVSETLLNVAGFAVVFCIVAVLLYLVGKIIHGLVKMVSLGWLDWVLGLVFAILKAGLIIGVVLIFFDTINLKFELVAEEKINSSVLYAPIRDFSYKIFPYLKALLFKQ